MHLLEKEITLNAPADKVWEFLATPLNLNELTPPDLDFKIISEADSLKRLSPPPKN